MVALLVVLAVQFGWLVPARLDETRRRSEQILREFREERSRESERAARLREATDAVLRDLGRIKTLQEDILSGGKAK